MRNRYSQTFHAALEESDPAVAISLYTKEIEENDSQNIDAWHNRGALKVSMGRDANNADLILEGIYDIRVSIVLANRKGKRVTMAKRNLKSAIAISNTLR